MSLCSPAHGVEVVGGVGWCGLGWAGGKGFRSLKVKEAGKRVRLLPGGAGCGWATECRQWLALSLSLYRWRRGEVAVLARCWGGSLFAGSEAGNVGNGCLWGSEMTGRSVMDTLAIL